jgi:hypothetical protein
VYPDKSRTGFCPQRRVWINASPVRLTAAVFPDAKGLYGSVLGSERRGSAAKKDMWSGHLGVAIGNEWLCDATLDQANKPEWGAVCVRPLVVPVTAEFFSGETIFLSLPGIQFRYNIFARQNGWKSAPDARPSHWLPLAYEILNEIPMTSARLHRSVRHALMSASSATHATKTCGKPKKIEVPIVEIDRSPEAFIGRSFNDFPI